MAERTRKAAVIRPVIEQGRRVLAISDIHGNLPFLKCVLEEACFSP
jgi:protein phosphatase